MDIKMAWRNVWRNPRRTFLTIAAIAFAAALLVFMLSFQFGSYDAMIDTAVTIHAGHLQVQASGYRENKEIRKVVADPQAVVEAFQKTGGITAHTLRANAFSLVSSEQRTYGAMVIGIAPSTEASTSRLKRLVRRGAYLSSQDRNQALLGERLAQNLRVAVGSELTLLGQGRDGSIAATVVRVKGIFRSGVDELDRRALHVPLAFFQEVYSMGTAVHEVVAVADTLDRVAAVKSRLSRLLDQTSAGKNLVVLDWKELMPGLSQGIQMDLVSGMIMYVLLIVVVAFSILNTFLMAVFERTREFGVMMAIGCAPARLTRLLLVESTVMTVLGIAAGMIMGTLVTLYFQAHGIDLSGASEILDHFGIQGLLFPKLSLVSATLGPAVVLLMTFAAALYPALKIRRLPPLQALRYG